MLGRVVPCWSAPQQPWNSFKGRAVTLHQDSNQHRGQRPSTASWETNKRVVNVEEDERDSCSLEKNKNSALWGQWVVTVPMELHPAQVRALCTLGQSEGQTALG